MKLSTRSKANPYCRQARVILARPPRANEYISAMFLVDCACGKSEALTDEASKAHCDKLLDVDCKTETVVIKTVRQCRDCLAL